MYFPRNHNSFVVCLNVRDLLYLNFDSLIIHPRNRCISYRTLDNFVVYLKLQHMFEVKLSTRVVPSGSWIQPDNSGNAVFPASFQPVPKEKSMETAGRKLEGGTR